MKKRYYVASSLISSFIGCFITITAATPLFTQQWIAHLINAYAVTIVLLAVYWIGILIMLAILKKCKKQEVSA